MQVSVIYIFLFTFIDVGQKTCTLILGTGPVAVHAAMALQRQSTLIGGFLSEDPQEVGKSVLDIPVVGTCDVDEIEERWQAQPVSFFVAVLQERLYVDVYTRLFSRLCNAIDPSVIIGPGLQIGRNVLVEAGAVLGPAVEIGDGSWIGPHARLATAVQLRKKTIIGAGVTLSEGVHIGKNVHVGAHSYVAPRLEVGAGAYIGPLTVLLQHVPADARVSGQDQVNKNNAYV